MPVGVVTGWNWLLALLVLLVILMIVFRKVPEVPNSPPGPPPPGPPPGVLPRVIIVKQTSNVTDQALVDYVLAQQDQVSTDFAAHYTDARILINSSPGTDPTSYPVFLLDDSDLQGALAYHTVDQGGRPFAKVFVLTCLSVGVSWQSAASHEILEMLADPSAVQTVVGPNGRPWALEVCDPCEAQIDPSTPLPDQLSDFVLPSWFDPRGSAPFDVDNVLTKPFSVAAGGYAQYQDVNGQWVNIQGDKATGTNRL